MVEHAYKLLFAGSMGAGKTTAIAAVSEVEPVRTEMQNNDDRTFAKHSTTTGLDYGQISLPDGRVLRLFGTPGQERFHFMWKILGEGALGVVLLTDNSRPDPLADLRLYAEAFAGVIDGSRAVVGVGRYETHPAPTLDDYSHCLRELGLNVPVVSTDVRKRSQVMTLLNILFCQIEVATQGDVLTAAGAQPV